MSSVARSAVQLARLRGNTKIIYVEHTPILQYWPPIDADYLFLSGEFSFWNLKKRSGSIKGDVFLLGSPKNDGLRAVLNSERISTVGICVSTVDCMERVRDVLWSLKSHPSYRSCVVRPHPSF